MEFASAHTPAPTGGVVTERVRSWMPPMPQLIVHALQNDSLITQSRQPSEHGVVVSTTLSTQPTVRCAAGVVTVRAIR
jgi:hypothetical protein